MNWLIYFASAFLGRSSSAASMLYVRFKSQTARTSECFVFELETELLGQPSFQGHLSEKSDGNGSKTKQKTIRIYLGEYKKHMLILIVLSNRTNEQANWKRRKKTSLFTFGPMRCDTLTYTHS